MWSRNSLGRLTLSKCLLTFSMSLTATSSSSNFRETPSTLRISGNRGTVETLGIATGGGRGLYRLSLSVRSRKLFGIPFRIGESFSGWSPSGTFRLPGGGCPFKFVRFEGGAGSIWTRTHNRRHFCGHSEVSDPSSSFQPSSAAPFAVWLTAVLPGATASPPVVDVVGSDISLAVRSSATRWARTYS